MKAGSLLGSSTLVDVSGPTSRARGKSHALGHLHLMWGTVLRADDRGPSPEGPRVLSGEALRVLCPNRIARARQ